MYFMRHLEKICPKFLEYGKTDNLPKTINKHSNMRILNGEKRV